MAIFAAYLERIELSLLPVLERMFGSMRKNKQGNSCCQTALLGSVLHDEGQSPCVSWFDQLKRDQSHASLLGYHAHELASSHAVKKVFQRFQLCPYLPVPASPAKNLYLGIEKHHLTVVELGLNSYGYGQ